jgi:hypothetical protein
MGITKLLENLNAYLVQGGKKSPAKCDQIDDLLDQLRDKEKKLKKKLEKEKNRSKRKRLKTDLKIVAVQLKKGRKRRDEVCQ